MLPPLVDKNHALYTRPFARPVAVALRDNLPDTLTNQRNRLGGFNRSLGLKLLLGTASLSSFSAGARSSSSALSSFSASFSAGARSSSSALSSFSDGARSSSSAGASVNCSPAVSPATLTSNGVGVDAFTGLAPYAEQLQLPFCTSLQPSRVWRKGRLLAGSSSRSLRANIRGIWGQFAITLLLYRHVIRLGLSSRDEVERLLVCTGCQKNKLLGMMHLGVILIILVGYKIRSALLLSLSIPHPPPNKCMMKRSIVNARPQVTLIKGGRICRETDPGVRALQWFTPSSLSGPAADYAPSLSVSASTCVAFVFSIERTGVCMPISEAFTQIQQQPNIYDVVHVKSYDEEPLKFDIVISFPDHGFHLRFDPWSQLNMRLRLIEIFDVKRLQVRYATSLIGGASMLATFVAVYALFGPTYPGIYDKDLGVYTLFYPGLSFVFPVPSQYGQFCHDREAEVPLEFPDGTTPVACRISGYDSSTGRKVGVGSSMMKACVPPLAAGSLYMEEVAVKVI
ncbi:hypothetical protein SASPL_145151 [Salvia splendens]|uniref:Uncharacterized protein n=1 Tax=Salvia splendens TaxID=180675 RepID=A0A8X8Z7W3_SALSN|nr:hypothetical protein SASPL_145151 [Salvia splendens]